MEQTIKLTEISSSKRFAVVADVHAGHSKFGLSWKQYLKPLSEVADYCRKNDVTLLVAGDLFHHRNPAVPVIHEVNRLLRDIKCIIAAGNHDIRLPKLPNTLSLMRGGKVNVQGNETWNPVRANLFDGILIAIVDWPMLENYSGLFDDDDDIETKLDKAREQFFKQLHEAYAEFPGKPDLIVGHAHVYNPAGGDKFTPPSLLAGRDILLPLPRLYEHLNSKEGLLLGHIHQPVNPYVGSTQPTDFGDTGQKSWTKINIDTQRNITRSKVPYSPSSLQVQVREVPLEQLGDGSWLLEGVTPNHVLMLTITDVKASDHIDLLALRKTLAPSVAHVQINVIRDAMQKRALVLGGAGDGEKITIANVLAQWVNDIVEEPLREDVIRYAVRCINEQSPYEDSTN